MGGSKAWEKDVIIQHNIISKLTRNKEKLLVRKRVNYPKKIKV